MFCDFLTLVSGGFTLRGFSSHVYTPLPSLLLPLPQLAGSRVYSPSLAYVTPSPVNWFGGSL
jgi:hypothetical protein